MTTLLILAALALSPIEDVPRDRCDLIEINHFMDERWREVFVQQVFYDWAPYHSQYIVRAWRLAKRAEQYPAWDFARAAYVVTWHDGDTLRQVQAPLFRVSQGQQDPELIDRNTLPKDHRRELSRLRGTTPGTVKRARHVGRQVEMRPPRPKPEPAPEPAPATTLADKAAAHPIRDAAVHIVQLPQRLEENMIAGATWVLVMASAGTAAVVVLLLALAWRIVRS
jgi:hypothetical protein